jgi:hypothetical protein
MMACHAHVVSFLEMKKSNALPIFFAFAILLAPCWIPICVHLFRAIVILPLQQAQFEKREADIMWAVQRYWQEQGHYPADLEELAPDYLSKAEYLEQDGGLVLPCIKTRRTNSTAVWAVNYSEGEYALSCSAFVTSAGLLGDMIKIPGWRKCSFDHGQPSCRTISAWR